MVPGILTHGPFLVISSRGSVALLCKSDGLHLRTQQQQYGRSAKCLQKELTKDREVSMLHDLWQFFRAATMLLILFLIAFLLNLLETPTLCTPFKKTLSFLIPKMLPDSENTKLLYILLSSSCWLAIKIPC